MSLSNCVPWKQVNHVTWCCQFFPQNSAGKVHFEHLPLRPLHFHVHVGNLTGYFSWAPEFINDPSFKPPRCGFEVQLLFFTIWSTWTTNSSLAWVCQGLVGQVHTVGLPEVQVILSCVESQAEGFLYQNPHCGSPAKATGFYRVWRK